MIRPITLLMFFLACGSGMFLYHEKHRTHVLDQQIDQTVKHTEELRTQTRALHAEWMLLNDPDRLRRLSSQFLTNLQPVAPTQFTDLADLDSRLPAPVAPTPATPPPAEIPAVASATPPASDQTAANAGSDTQSADAMPAPPPAPPAAPAAQVADAHVQAPHADVAHVDAPRIDATRLAAAPAVQDRRPHPVVAAAQPPRTPAWHPAATPHPVIAEATPLRFARPEPHIVPVSDPRRPSYAPPPPAYSGSMLGMARGMQNLPAPQPMLPRPEPMPAVYGNAGG